MHCSAQPPVKPLPPPHHTLFSSGDSDKCSFVFLLVKNQSRFPSRGERDGISPTQPGLSLPEGFLLVPFPPEVDSYFLKPQNRSTARVLPSLDGSTAQGLPFPRQPLLLGSWQFYPFPAVSAPVHY